MRKSILIVLLLTSLALPACAQDTSADPAPAIVTQALPFSPVIVSGDTIFLAGHLGRVPNSNDYPTGGIGAETTQTLENIGVTLATVDATHADLVRCQVFLADIADFAAMNAAYRKFFPSNPPARTTVAVSGLAANASIEIECTGRIGHGTASGETTHSSYRPPIGSNNVLRAAITGFPIHEMVMQDVVLPPEGVVSRHCHPAEEYIYILEGSTILFEDGKAARTLTPGDAYAIPSKTEHSAAAGPGGMRAAVVRIQPEGRPERVRVKANGSTPDNPAFECSGDRPPSEE